MINFKIPDNNSIPVEQNLSRFLILRTTRKIKYDVARKSLMPINGMSVEENCAGN